MNPTLIELFQVTTCALNKQIYQGAISNDKEFYFKTVENGLSGLVFSALNKDQITKQLFEHLQKDTMLYILKDTLQLEAIENINKMLTEAEVKHLFLKGSRLKKIYPETYMRAMGDIDLLVHPNDMNKVHQVFDLRDIKCISRSTSHDVFEMKNNLKIEIHPSIYRDFNEAYESIFVDAWKYAKHTEDHLFELPHEYELVYLLYHLAKHIHLGGVGIRSILDIGLYLSAYHQEINRNILIEYLNQSNLYTFFQSMIYLNIKYFNIDHLESWTAGYTMEEDLYEKITEFFSVSGIHGKGMEFNSFTPRMASNKLQHKNKFKFIISVIFPNLESVKGMYPFVRRVPFLLPVGWMFRWVRLIFRHPKSTFDKIGKLKIKDQEIEDITNLFKKIGLK